MITTVAGVITNRFHTMPPPRDEKLVSFTEECHTLLFRLLCMIENARRVIQYPMTVIDWMSDAVGHNWSECVRIIQLRNENASIAWISPHAASWFEFTSWYWKGQDQQLSAPQPTVKELKLAVSAAVPSHKIERTPGMQKVSIRHIRSVHKATDQALPVLPQFSTWQSLSECDQRQAFRQKISKVLQRIVNEAYIRPTARSVRIDTARANAEKT